MVQAGHAGAACRWTRCCGVETSAGFALVRSYGGYTTNLPLEDLLGGKAWIAFGYDGKALAAEHGGPARLLVPHLYLWKSAKWVTRHRPAERRRAGVLGDARLSQLRGPMAGTAVLGRLTWLVGTVASARDETATARTIALEVPGWPGHRAGQHVDVRLTARGRLLRPAVLLDRLRADGTRST